MAHLLGIDIGTSGTKTLVCDPKGKVLATAMAEHTLLTPKPAGPSSGLRNGGRPSGRRPRPC